MKSSRLAKLFSVIMCAIITVTGLCIPASAAARGATMDTAISVTFDKSYSKSWDRKTRNVSCYNKIKVTNRGILTINATKPYDDDGEYGKLSFRLYDSDGEIVWANDTNSSVKNANSKYKKYVGLNKGTYYLNITPDFYVTSGTIKTTYSFSFTKNSKCEVESNESTAKATELKVGKMYTAHYGSDGARYDGSENDYFKFTVKKGCFYTVQFDDYDKISGTTALVEILNKSGKEVKDTEVILNSGKTALAFQATANGVHYIKFRNYGGEQFKYKIGIAKYTAKPDEVIIEDVNAWSYKDIIEIDIDHRYHSEIKKTSSGYQVSYSRNEDFSDAKTENVKFGSHYIDLEPASPTGTYYVRVRAYREIEGKTVYGYWSETFKAKF